MTTIKGNIFINGKFSNQYITFSDKIEEISPTKTNHDKIIEGEYVIPGFIDLHTNGGFGIGFIDLKKDEHDEFDLKIASEGITTYFPSFIGLPLNILLKNLSLLNWDLIEGIHLEGPFISHDKKGIHNLTLKPEVSYIKSILGVIPKNKKVILTIAPELDGISKLIDFSIKHGIILSSGHTDASFKDGVLAIDKGVKLCTHLFNAMRGLHHREPGIAFSYLNDKSTFPCMICDGIHVDPMSMSFVKKLADPSRLIAVTDHVPIFKSHKDHIKWGKFNLSIKNKIATINDTLAGSIATYNDIFKALKISGFTLEEIISMRTENPARALNLKGFGSLKVNNTSNILILNKDLKIISIFKEGKLIK